MRDKMKALSKWAADRLGYEVHRKDHSHAARRQAAMRARGVDLVLDVGANSGQYASELRAGGFTGAVVSFEPIPEVFAALRSTHGGDPRWRGVQAAVGDVPGPSSFNVMVDSSVLSSMLSPTELLRAAIPAAGATRRIEVDVITLDDVWDELVPAGARVMLKIDAQGFEHPVLEGATRHLPDVVLLELEMSLVPLYDGGSSIQSLLPRLSGWGFDLVTVDSDGGFVEVATGQALDVNVLAGRAL